MTDIQPLTSSRRLLALVLALLCPAPAGAFSAAVAVGGGGRLSPDSGGFFCADFSAGVRLPFRYWHSDVFFFPRLGVELDGARHPDARLYVGPGAGFIITSDELTLGLEPDLLTDFHDLGIRAQLHLGFAVDVFQVTIAYDALFKDGGPRHSIRAMVGIDLGALFIGLLRLGGG